MPRIHARPAVVASTCARFVTSHRRTSHRAVGRDSAGTCVQRSMTAHAAFPGPCDTASAFTPRTRMIERMTAEMIAMSKLASYRVAAGEASATDDIDRSRIVSE
jgi:hypothetical protein